MKPRGDIAEIVIFITAAADHASARIVRLGRCTRAGAGLVSLRLPSASPTSRLISASPGSRRVSPAENGAAPFAPGGTRRRRYSPQHPRNARAWTARDVRQPRRCAVAAHPAHANLLSEANLDAGRLRWLGFPIRGLVSPATRPAAWAPSAS